MKFRITTKVAVILATLMTVPQIMSSAKEGRVLAEPGAVNATAPGQAVSAGYARVRNSSKRVETIIGASSPTGATVEIHNTTITGGVARMRKVESLSIPAGGEVRFAPGGYHFMISGLRSRLVAGQRFPVRLHFNSGHSVDLAMPVTSAGVGKAMGHAHHGAH